jgi:hypothetical protein
VWLGGSVIVMVGLMALLGLILIAMFRAICRV